MIAGYIVLTAILLAIAASAIRLFPSFAKQLRIGVHLAEKRQAPRPRAVRPKRPARVIEFPLSRVAGR